MTSLVFKKLSDNSIHVVSDHSPEFHDIVCSPETYLFLSFMDDEIPEDYYPHVQY